MPPAGTGIAAVVYCDAALLEDDVKAVLEPVEIGGVIVKLATLHNEDLVHRKDLRVGDIVQVKRAGEVIPQLIGPIPEKSEPRGSE